jgi:phycocyanin beta chain
MNEAFIRAVSQADARGQYVSSEQIDALKSMIAEGVARMDAVNHISRHAPEIVSRASRALFIEQPQLIAPGGNAYTTRRMAACLRDMDVILRYITHALFSGDASVLDDHCLSGLRETYLALDVPIGSMVRAIQKMKDITLRSLTSQEGQDELRELKISEIRKSYPKQWVTIKVTKSENGFPSAGKVMHHDHDLDKLADRVSQFSGDNIYTFFTNKIDEKPEPLVKTNTSKIILTSEHQSLLSELASYFDRAIFSFE